MGVQIQFEFNSYNYLNSTRQYPLVKSSPHSNVNELSRHENGSDGSRTNGIQIRVASLYGCSISRSAHVSHNYLPSCIVTQMCSKCVVLPHSVRSCKTRGYVHAVAKSEYVCSGCRYSFIFHLIYSRFSSRITVSGPTSLSSRVT